MRDAEELLAGALLGPSVAMRRVRELLLRLAESKAPVLVEGESGSGKDLVAHWLHACGPRRDAAFVKLHCPSIPEALAESDLFGHEKGAFTDAQRAKPGKLELANGGTVYFDQVQDLAPLLQSKLLRVVEEQRFERLGGTRTIEVDVRFVSSSAIDLRAAAAQGRFREDLYHRLGVVPLRLPPLRERREDVAVLADCFLARERARGNARARGFEPEAMEALQAYGWPGNARELRGAIERAAVLEPLADTLGLEHLPPEVREPGGVAFVGRTRRPSLKEVERAYLRRVLDEVGGNQTLAAEILGISRKALWEKRRRFGLP